MSVGDQQYHQDTNLPCDQGWPHVMDQQFYPGYHHFYPYQPLDSQILKKLQELEELITKTMGVPRDLIAESEEDRTDNDKPLKTP